VAFSVSDLGTICSFTEKQEHYLAERYDQLMQTWIKKVERIENNAKRRYGVCVCVCVCVKEKFSHVLYGYCHFDFLH